MALKDSLNLGGDDDGPASGPMLAIAADMPSKSDFVSRMMKAIHANDREAFEDALTGWHAEEHKEMAEGHEEPDGDEE